MRCSMKALMKVVFDEGGLDEEQGRRLRCEDLFNSRRYGFQLDEEQKGDDQLEIRCAETES